MTEIKKLNKLSYEIFKDTYRKLKQINKSHPDYEYYSRVLDLTYKIYLLNQPKVEYDKEYECIWESDPNFKPKKQYPYLGEETF